MENVISAMDLEVESQLLKSLDMVLYVQQNEDNSQ